jgi:adenylylsulfate kinase
LNRGFVIWLTGLPASGKTTIARQLETQLKEVGRQVEVFDGDEVRKNLSSDLGFSKEHRKLHAMRVAYVSKLLARNGIIAVVALISPFREFRDDARQQIDNFVEVYVKCSLETCEKRDPKGLYTKAALGQIKDLTGPQEPYEEPVNPEVTVDTERFTAEDSVKRILSTVTELGLLARN